LFLIAFLFVPLLSAFTAAQPQPDPAAKIRVESVEVNLTQHPAFQFVVAIPTVLRFEAGDAAGVRYLHIWAYSRVDSLDVRIRKATNYLDSHAGIFSPLTAPPNRMRLADAGSPLRGYLLANTLSRDNLAAR
jgi:hypothetical protein